jgi:protein-disulfide isomerase
MNRRRFLAVGAAGALAGCLGGGDGGGGDDTGGGGQPTSGGSDQTLADHPAARDLAAQPQQGPDPDEATAVIVAFEDPSCPTCKRFEEDVVPQIQRNLVDPGTATLVFRGYPVIYPWGEPAVRALEATVAADPAAHWTLAEHYFAEQSSFRGSDETTVYDRTETFLAENTDVDAAAVVDAARAGDADAAVQTDLDAGMAGGAGGTTPHLFLFREGVYQTKAAGSVSYDLITTILEL